MRRIQHLITYGDRETINSSKIAWLSRTGQTIQRRDLFTNDNTNDGHHAYIKKYPEGIHTVIVDSDGK